jgi:hypothetical protein
MIFTLWIVFIGLEAFTHAYVIHELNIDPTPDGKFTFKHFCVIGARYIVYLVLWWVLGIKGDAEFWMFTLGCLFTHLLLFAPILNLLTMKPIHYLGQGTVDKVLAYLPFQARVWFLLVLSAGMIYGYFNTDLL